MTKLFFLLAVMFSVDAFSQPDYNIMIREGDKERKDNNFVEALKKYDAAEYAYPSRKDEIKRKRDSLFDKIAAVGKNSGKEKSQIKRLLDTIQSQKETIKIAFDLANTNLDLASSNIAKSQKYINGLNLVNGNLAIVFKEPKGGSNPKYGFINQAGDVVIDYKYENVFPFDYTGFARVIWANFKGEEISYLIDKSGREYRSIYHVGAIDKNVEALDLRDTIINDFPAQLLSQSQLKVILLQGNTANEFTIPQEIQIFKNLECLSSLGNIIESLPAEIGSLNKLRSLIISNGQLKKLPDEISKLDNIELLDLSGNSMRTFPEEIFLLKNLQSLYLASNGFKTLPGKIRELTNLQSLDLHWNSLKELPPAIGNLKNLQYLNLDKNLLEELPAEIGQLENLQALILTGNQLKSFPMQILPLTFLELLDLSNNKSLKTIPPEASQLKNLRTLKLVNTSIPVSEQVRIKKILPWCYIIFNEQK